MTAAGPAAGRLRVAIVAASDFEFESRLRKTALTLAEDGHSVTIVALSGPGLAATETMADRVELRRVTLDRRISTGLRPLPGAVRTWILRAAGLDPEAVTLPAARPGADRLRAVVRRGLEILAALRRTGPWTDAVVDAAPDAGIVHAKALIALPVARAAARRTTGRPGRYVYDVADLHSGIGSPGEAAQDRPGGHPPTRARPGPGRRRRPGGDPVDGRRRRPTLRDCPSRSS